MENQLQEIHATIIEIQLLTSEEKKRSNLAHTTIEDKIAYLHQLFTELKNDNTF